MNALGTGGWSDEIRLVAADAPGQPTLTLLEATRSLEGFRLSFGRPASDGGSPLIGYLLYHDEGIAGSPFTLAFNGSSQPELAGFTVTGLRTALTYRFELYALNRVYRSAMPASLDLLVGTLPDRPLRIRRAEAAFVPGQIAIEWTAPGHTGGVDLVGYLVWLDDGAGDFSASLAPAASPAAGASGTVLSGLTTGLTYGVRMTAVNLVGPSADSDIVYLVCADRPAAPAAPSAESSTRSSITLAWNEPTSAWQSPVTGYRVYMNDLAVGDWVLAYEGEGYPTRQVYVVEGLAAGGQYRFKVSAENAVGASPNGTEALFTASDYPAGPGQP